LEEQMISQVLSMSGRLDKSLFIPDKTLLTQGYGLQEEQIDAVKFLLESSDIACLVGRAGTGKTFTMKAVHDWYAQRGFRVYGAALSGIAAKELEAKTGIPSDTIHSLSYRISRKEFQPKPGSILVIDEAGMVALQDMARIIDFAKTAHCKVFLLGDPDQLQPIMAGAPFRAILNHVGFAEMKHIQRQENAKDREASTYLASGKVGQAVDHYVSQNKLNLIESEQVQVTLLNTWEASLEKDLSTQIILAYTRKQVAELNASAREILLKKGLISTYQSQIQTSYGNLNFSLGDRIVFLKNNRDLGVCNGDFGTIQSIEGSKVQVQVKDRSLSFDSSQYKDFNYGYAVTVHKSQGATFDRAFVYLDGWGWDRFLSYVAFTRHRKELNVFANKTHYQNLDGLKKQLAQAKVRDNAIDYPLSFSERRGFDPESMLGRALDFMAGVGNKIQEGWLYVRNVESFVKAQEQKNRVRNDATIRRQAKQQFLNLKADQSPEISVESWIRDSSWEKLKQVEGRLLRENIEVLLNLREKFLDPKISENQREFVSKAFVSMVEKAFSNERFRKNLIGLSPEIGKHIPFALRSLISSLERERGR
jgi:Ti-type conjugative transfer relaxase TraA